MANLANLVNNTIFEDGYNQKTDFDNVREKLMDKEEIKRADFYSKEYSELKAEKESLEEEWIQIQDAFSSDRTEDETGREIPFVNVMTSNIEGQLATMTERNIKASIQGKGVSDEGLANTLEPAADAIFRENKIRRKIKKIGRRYLLYGNTFVVVGWDKDRLTEGMPTIITPVMTDILIDGKIKDFDDINDADFVIREVGSKSIIWARRKFGDEMAEAITLGQQISMDGDIAHDDIHSFTYLEIWTKNNEQENLQLIKMTTTGLLLEESDAAKPYYTHVNNKYPVFAIELYPMLNKLHGFGDGKLLLPLQRLVNRLYDEIILAIKFSSQGRTYVDPKARLNPNEFAEADPKKPIIVNNPTQTIKTERGVGINAVVFNLLEQVFRKVEEVTRFSALMTGNDTQGAMTATQSNIMMQQGNTGVTDKQTDISRMMSDVLEYCLGLSLQFWTTEKAFRIANVDDDESRTYEWISPSRYKEVPIKVPATREYIANFRKNNPKGKTPTMMLLTDKAGTTMTKNIELDIKVSVGEGMPNNKAAMYQMVLQLAQTQIVDSASGQPRSLFSYKQVKDMMEDILGIRIKESEKGTVAEVPGGGKMNMNAPSANVEGQNVKGNPSGV